MKLLILLSLIPIALCSTHLEWVVQLDHDVDPRVFGLEHKLHYVKEHPSLKGFHLFKSKQDQDQYALEASLLSNPQVEWAERQIPRKQHTRSETHLLMGRYGDPAYARQWHLHDPPQHGDGISVKADKAWAKGYTGRGVTIAIVDDGVQIAHPDLKVNIDRKKSWDFNHNRADPSPSSYNGHGTSAAGVCCAVRNNGHCGCGAAPDVTLVAEQLISGPVSDYTESLALSHYPNNVDIYSCSWGPADTGQDMVKPGTLMERIFERGVRTGRKGKGNIFVWAGGNGRAHDDNCNYDGYASSRFTLAIGAIDHDGKQSWYSEPCAALIAVAPSSGARKGITTTDITGQGGYTAGECTDTFGGTSSAAPLAAGVVALMLQARPDLTWRDVQHVIAKHSKQIDIGIIADDWHTNSRGYHHSHKYGFGHIVAPDLVDGAKSHALVPAQKGHSQTTHPNKAIPNSAGQLRAPISFTGSGISFVEHVTVQVRMSHPRRGEIGIRLVSPEGTVSVLAERRRDTHPAKLWTYTSLRHFGERRADGEWSVEFQDLAPHNAFGGSVSQVKINIYGY